MLRRTRPSGASKFRLKSDLTYKSPFGLMWNTGFNTPYAVWNFKQKALFRNVHEDQHLHLRKVYARQYYEAYIANADEFASKYNVTKAATMAEWEAELEAQERKRQDEFEKVEGRRLLKLKHLDILRERREKSFFHWYERASERIQYMSETMRFVTRENLDAHIEAELSKYEVGATPEETAARAYPLNFVGQMPYLETHDLQVAAGTQSMVHRYRASRPDSDIGVYEPPLTPSAAAAAAGADAAAQAPISGAVRALDDAEYEALMADIVDDMAAAEQPGAAGGVDSEELLSTETAEDAVARRRASIDRRKVGGKMATFQEAGNVTVGNAPTAAETKAALKRQGARARRDKKQRRGDGDERRAALLQKNLEAAARRDAMRGKAAEDAAAAAGASSDAAEAVADPTMPVDHEAERKAREALRAQRYSIAEEDLEVASQFGADKGGRMSAVAEAMEARGGTFALPSKEDARRHEAEFLASKQQQKGGKGGKPQGKGGKKP